MSAKAKLNIGSLLRKRSMLASQFSEMLNPMWKKRDEGIL